MTTLVLRIFRTFLPLEYICYIDFISLIYNHKLYKTLSPDMGNQDHRYLIKQTTRQLST